MTAVTDLYYDSVTGVIHRRGGSAVAFMTRLFPILGHQMAAAPETVKVLDARPIMSKYHGCNGFEVEQFIVDYEAWSVMAREVLAKARGE